MWSCPLHWRWSLLYVLGEKMPRVIYRNNSISIHDICLVIDLWHRFIESNIFNFGFTSIEMKSYWAMTVWSASIWLDIIRGFWPRSFAVRFLGYRGQNSCEESCLEIYHMSRSLTCKKWSSLCGWPFRMRILECDIDIGLASIYFGGIGILLLRSSIFIHFSSPWCGQSHKTWRGRPTLPLLPPLDCTQHCVKGTWKQEPIIDMIFKLCEEVVQTHDYIKHTQQTRDTDRTTSSDLIYGALLINDLEKKQRQPFNTFEFCNKLVQSSLGPYGASTEITKIFPAFRDKRRFSEANVQLLFVL